MAATRLTPLHIGKGRTLAQCLADRTDYAQNPEKTEKGQLVTSYECDPMTADEEFLLTKRLYEHKARRTFTTTSFSILLHSTTRESFAMKSARRSPGNAMPCLRRKL